MQNCTNSGMFGRYSSREPKSINLILIFPFYLDDTLFEGSVHSQPIAMKDFLKSLVILEFYRFPFSVLVGHRSLRCQNMQKKHKLYQSFLFFGLFSYEK